jgi:hypothetical protein
VQVQPLGGVAESSLAEEMRLEQKAQPRVSARLVVPEPGSIVSQPEEVAVVPVQHRLALLPAGSELSWATDPRG